MVEDVGQLSCPACKSQLDARARYCGACGCQLGRPTVVTPSRLATGSGTTGSIGHVGQILNHRYRVEAKIGEGGFSTVYRGVQLATGRNVALKLLHFEKANDEDMVARFHREAHLLCSLRDPHTVTTYDFDTSEDGTPYIAMELLGGKSLDDVLHADSPLAWERALKIVAEMCTSLGEAHARGIVHRDLKPENVFLESWPDNPEFVKVLDFGIAKPMRPELDMDITQIGQTVGTPQYMSPEQLVAQPLDGRSDIYTLGVMLYEMVTGRLPYIDAPGPVALIAAQLMGPPPAPSAFNAAIPAEVDQIVLRCLAMEKRDRFADAGELAYAINELIVTSSGSAAVALHLCDTEPVEKVELVDKRDTVEMDVPPLDPDARGKLILLVIALIAIGVAVGAAIAIAMS
jgi:serine/threonine protein kinase